MHSFQSALIIWKFSPRIVLKLRRGPQSGVLGCFIVWVLCKRHRIFSLKTRVRKFQRHLNSRIFRCTMALTRTTKIASQMQTGKLEILFGKSSFRGVSTLFKLNPDSTIKFILIVYSGVPFLTIPDEKAITFDRTPVATSLTIPKHFRLTFEGEIFHFTSRRGITSL